MIRRNLTILITILLLSSLAFGQKNLTVEDIYGTVKFAPKFLSSVQWIPGDKAFTYTERESGILKLFYHDIRTGKRILLLDSDKIPQLENPKREKRYTISNYIWSPDGKKILLPSGTDIYLYNVKTKTVTQLTDDSAEERDPTFSPDGKKIAYLKNWNLYVLDIASKIEKKLTTHGREDVLIGRFDWVYEEEFGIRTGFFWSPDSRKIAFFELNQAHETDFPVVDFIPVHNPPNLMKYPKSGDPNAVVWIGVVSADDGDIVWMDIGSNKDIYIPRIAWLNDSQQLAIQRLNRDQNKLYLLFGHVETGKTRLILTEYDPEGWVDPCDQWSFLKDNKHFVWSSERSNWRHLYLYTLDGVPVRQITDGNWAVTQLAGVDEKRKTITFVSTKKKDIERHIYIIDFDGKNLKRLSQEDGFHTINSSPDHQYYINIFSNYFTPPRTTLHRADGRLIRTLESGTIKALEEIELAAPNFFKVETEDGYTLNAMMIKPVDFDPQKKYPILVYNYPGPGAQRVQNNWYRGMGNLWHQMMTQKGYIIFTMDGRGSGFKGKAFKNILYRNMGRGITDQINGAKYLQTLSYVDPDRIGIWGWSGGGWGACMALTKGADYFKTGAAVASVTDFRNYDTIWTERYMGQPDDNPEGYAESNPITYVDNYKRGLLLIHGSSDDNVHLSNAMQLAYALQNARKPFQMMIYPRKDHSIRGSDTRIHLFNTITEFFLKNL
jgi:dipeptidyl-peptidase-4